MLNSYLILTHTIGCIILKHCFVKLLSGGTCGESSTALLLYFSSNIDVCKKSEGLVELFRIQNESNKEVEQLRTNLLGHNMLAEMKSGTLRGQTRAFTAEVFKS